MLGTPPAKGRTMPAAAAQDHRRNGRHQHRHSAARKSVDAGRAAPLRHCWTRQESRQQPWTHRQEGLRRPHDGRPGTLSWTWRRRPFTTMWPPNGTSCCWWRTTSRRWWTCPPFGAESWEDAVRTWAWSYRDVFCQAHAADSGHRSPARDGCATDAGHVRDRQRRVPGGGLPGGTDRVGRSWPWSRSSSVRPTMSRRRRTFSTPAAWPMRRRTSRRRCGAWRHGATSAPRTWPSAWGLRRSFPGSGRCGADGSGRVGRGGYACRAEVGHFDTDTPPFRPGARASLPKVPHDGGTHRVLG